MGVLRKGAFKPELPQSYVVSVEVYLECVTFLGGQQKRMLPIEPEMEIFCHFKETRKD